MKLLTSEIMASRAAAKWLNQFKGYEMSRDAATVFSRLVALGPNPSIDHIVQIIGPRGRHWIDRRCSECGEYNVPVVELGGRWPGQTETVCCCQKCAERILKMLRGKRRP